MAVERNQRTITVVAGQDLSGHQYKAVSLAGTVAGTAALAAGILKNKPENGEHATLAYEGDMKAFAGGAINSNALITVAASGFMTPYTPSGSGGLGAVGRALESAASGQVFRFIANFFTAGNEV